MKIKNNNGPKTEPWGIPDNTRRSFENAPPTYVKKWVKDVEKLSVFAEDEPQAALSAYSKGVSSRWQYLQRTVPDISEMFRPMEVAIRNKFIPALIGRPISYLERRIFALPYRYGGLAIRNPVIMSEEEYRASKTITAELTKSIVNQQKEISSINDVAVKLAKEKFRKGKEEKLKNNFENICKLLPESDRKYLQTAAERCISMVGCPTSSKPWILSEQKRISRCHQT